MKKKISKFQKILSQFFFGCSFPFNYYCRSGNVLRTCLNSLTYCVQINYVYKTLYCLATRITAIHLFKKVHQSSVDFVLKAYCDMLVLASAVTQSGICLINMRHFPITKNF